jgi:hypothetical protein
MNIREQSMHPDRVSLMYKRLFEMLTPEEIVKLRTKDYWLQRDKFPKNTDKQKFTIKWINDWKKTGIIGNGVVTKPRPDARESALKPDMEF